MVFIQNKKTFRAIGAFLFMGLLLISSVHLEAFDPHFHEMNKCIFAKAVESQLDLLQPKTPQQAACELSLHLPDIAKKALEDGFNPHIYFYKKSARTQELIYHAEEMWEGGKDRGQNPSIPLTFFVFIWPPEDLAKQTNAQSCFYASSIHSHPISCALMVLSGSITQEMYQDCPLRKIGEEVLKVGDFRFDDNNDPFIHRLVCRSSGTSPAITLHAYGAATTKEVDKIFEETRATHEREGL